MYVRFSLNNTSPRAPASATMSIWSAGAHAHTHPHTHTHTRAQTIDFVRTRLKDSGDEPPLSKTCGDLCDACCADTTDGDGTGLDNVTAVIVQLDTEGARALMHGGGVGGRSGSGSGDMDMSDDGKRKQGGGEEEEEGGRTKKQMKEAAAAAAAAEGTDGGGGGGGD